MLKLIQSIFRSRAFKLLLRILAGLASAIVVISGFLFYLNLGQRSKVEKNGKERSDESGRMPVAEDEESD